MPSFIWAAEGFDRGAMVVGVALFVTLYTVFTCTAGFERFHRRPFVRRTLYIGYGVRLGMSVAFPVGMAADLIPGLLSIGLVENVLGVRDKTFVGTLAVTIVQGTILNCIIAAMMGVVYGFQRKFCRPPEEPLSYGFQVVMKAE